MWPFDSQRKALAGLLPAEAPWLKDAEIAAWEPDANSKAQRFFASASVTREAFLAWAVASGLSVLRGERLPSSVWTLPDDVAMAHWTDAATIAPDMVEAKGLGPQSTLWARWNAGRVYLVAYPAA